MRMILTRRYSSLVTCTQSRKLLIFEGTVGRTIVTIILNLLFGKDTGRRLYTIRDSVPDILEYTRTLNIPRQVFTSIPHPCYTPLHSKSNLFFVHSFFVQSIALLVYVRACFVSKRCHSILHVGDGEDSGASLSLHAVLLCFQIPTQHQQQQLR